VLAFGHETVMLVGESGSGKSTTTWALLHHGCRYFSDELGPVDLQTGTVYPYPHALCLKDVPLKPYPLPRNTLYTARAVYTHSCPP
jgi:ABC-type cobalamin/Fe3+-siderophores transport system ATPase subunit